MLCEVRSAKGNTGSIRIVDGSNSAFFGNLTPLEINLMGGTIVSLGRRLRIPTALHGTEPRATVGSIRAAREMSPYFIGSCSLQNSLALGDLPMLTLPSELDPITGKVLSFPELVGEYCELSREVFLYPDGPRRLNAEQIQRIKREPDLGIIGRYLKPSKILERRYRQLSLF